MSVTYEQKGFRDVYWCNVVNEPTIVSYRLDPRDGTPWCHHCDSPIDDDHPFICHVGKPNYSAPR